ncbi:hypothetical protein KKC17_04555 [Patescibacteria group bacterium]|nr:hypothetical protein [Patescibacteria group bacterium]
MATKHPAKITISQPNTWVQKINIIAPLLVFIILLAGWLVAVRPLWNSLSQIENSDKIIEAQDKIKIDITQIEKINQQYQNLNDSELQRINLVLPKGRDIPTLLAQFEGLAKQAGLVMQSIDFIGSGDEGQVRGRVESNAGQELGLPFKVNSLQINVTLGSGSYEQIKKFVAAAAESIRLVELTSLTFSQSSTGVQSGYILNFKTLYLP